MTVKIQLRRGTAAEWTSANPTLLSGEQGLETDTGKTKIGDGVTAWNSLGYAFVQNALISGTKGAVPVGTGSAVAALSPGSNGQTLVADSTQTNGLRYRAPFISNHIINGGFDVWQRGTSGTTTSGIGYPSADRWNVWTLAAGGSVTLSRQTVSDSTNLPNARYCGRFQRVSGNTNTGILVLGQALETSTSIQMAGQSVTLSFWIRTGANFSATSMSGQVWSNTTTDAGLNTIQSGSSVLASVTVTPSSTWTRYTATGTVSTSATQIAVAFAYTPTGTAGTNDWFEITGVQLETGPVATPFEFEPYEATLRKCQRYYYLHAEGTGKAIGNAANYNSTSVYGVVHFPTTMRTAPSLTVATGTNFYRFNRNDTGDAFNSLAIGASTENTGRISNTSEISGTAGQAGWIVTNDAAASLAFSAEL